jgi:hypothetical protein
MGTKTNAGEIFVGPGTRIDGRVIVGVRIEIGFSTVDGVKIKTG